ncbi:mannitol dehydrogenase family protein [Fangia hongkongensis]|uniref:mannitol dehydrogenase family protein n=1 Tax=Fangia hongkongensis TaxID=270495 RepID=UPI0003787758|nr:mannitol dehydrogenase family protein [Fangia hongkongensis]MBK2123787.1 mannitol dehydrogenase family protein [Fangia hongkongensis]
MNRFYAIHIGLGAFHRAHQLYYFNQLLLKNTNKSNHLSTWHYISATIRSNKKLIDQLNQQNCQYTLVEESENESNYTQIHALEAALFAGEGNANTLVEYIADDAVKMLSYTITEKGYYSTLSDSTFQLDHADIIYDLNHQQAPKTAIGITAWGLHKRYKNHQSGITLISCDNLPHNGKILKNAILSFAKSIDNDFANWIDDNCTFPSTMVDRIVPAVSEHDIEKVNQHIGYKDLAPVITERFSQWVIEDNFASDKPPLENVGVQFVRDVAPFESMKLTMLNGSHSLIAYLGALAGFKTVSDAIAHPDIYKLIHYYMSKIAAPLVIGLPEEISLDDYKDQLLERFKNPHLAHKTEQIAADGSQKIPQRWLTNLQTLIKRQDNYEIYALGIAAWIIFTQGRNDQGNMLTVNDPLKDKFIASTDAKKLVQYYFSLESVFNPELQKNTLLNEKVLHYVKLITQQGTLAAIQSFLHSVTTSKSIELTKEKQ